MIQLCNSSVITVSEDGTRKVFEPEEIQAKLVRSCIASGIRDTWIAEDIALSVEYSLGELASSKVFTMSEIDSFVVKVLREVGFVEVADHYSTMQHSGLKTVPVSMDKISDIVSRFLGLENQELYSTSLKIQKVCTVLGLKEVFPSLILEFAKYYHYENFDAVTKHISLPLSSTTAEGVWAVRAEQIISTLSKETFKMIKEEIITVSDVSKLFPSVRINLSFANFATALALEPPITELAIIPFFDKLAIAVDDIIKSTESVYFASCESSVDELPIYMKFTDVVLFSTEWLGGEWSNASHCLKEMVFSLTEMLNRQVIVRNM